MIYCEPCVCLYETCESLVQGVFPGDVVLPVSINIKSYWLLGGLESMWYTLAHIVLNVVDVFRVETSISSS